MPSSASFALKRRAVKAEPLSEPSVSSPGSIIGRCRAFDDGDRFVGAAAQLELRGDDLACAAVDDRHQVAPAMLGDPDRGQVELPQLPRPLDPEEAGPLAPLQRPPPLDQLPLAHHPQHALAVDRDTEPAADEGADHPVAVGLVGERLLDDRLLNWICRRPALRRPPPCRRPVEGLATDPGDARHQRGRMPLGDQVTRAGDALSHSHSHKSFPAISSS
jgi:hypothetical protein